MVVVDDHDLQAKKVAIDRLRSKITFDGIADKINTCTATAISAHQTSLNE